MFKWENLDLDKEKIDEEVFTSDDFVKLLKLNGRFDGLMEDILRDKLAVQRSDASGPP